MWDYNKIPNIHVIRVLEGKEKEGRAKNIGRTLFDINCSKIFFDPPTRIMKIKTKINKWDLIKLKSFSTAKETINKTKRQHSEWEKRFANEATDKGLISKYTNSSCSSISKNKKPNTSAVAQWIGIRLPMQGTRVQSLVWEDPTWYRAIKPMCHNC